MLKLKAITCLIACHAIALSVFAQTGKGDISTKGEGNLSFVDPTIGNVGLLLQPTRPTVQLPNQMMRMYPLRNDYIDDEIAGFPLIVVSHRLGEAFSIKPVSGNPTLTGWKQKLPYDHDLETTRPWYYATHLLDDEINVEFVPGKKTGIYRFTFSPKAATRTLLLNTLNNGMSDFTFLSSTELTGTETYHNDIKVYLYGQFNTSGTTGVVKNNVLATGNTVSGSRNTKSYISFPQSNQGAIEFSYAISYISAAQARKNFEEERTGSSFEKYKAAAEAAWADVMGQIQVQGGTEAQKRSFYSALYRCYERMVDITEDGKYYSGFDKKIHSTTRPFYVDDWTWDTYLAHHPLRTILHPAQEEDMLNSYVSMYEQSGWLPTFPVLFGDHACMNGFHSSVTMLDAYRKGLRNFDINKAYEAMVKNATQATMLPWKNGPKCELDDIYLAKGYFPALHKGEQETVPQVHSFERRQAVAVTLGHSYDDWALAQLAKDLGHEADWKKFEPRGQNYRNLWNDKLKLFTPKDENGKWINIDPGFDGGKGGRDYYDENNGYTYRWQVQQDIKGLETLLGGPKAMEDTLDNFFRTGLGKSKHEYWFTFPDHTGNVGQYSMGNEPSFHIPYLYNYTGSPWKTQQRTRFLLDVWFKDNIFGIPGDEDGGGMCAFVVFSSLGFYPVTPGLPVYTIGSPLFEKSTIALENGKQFTVIAKNCSVVNKYIQSARFNGQSLNTPWFSHEQLMAGGTLELEMGPLPNKKWGVQQ